ncbi:MAG: DUF1553 domain-containing protein, partial [Planctomycetota bacterium]
AAHWAFVPPAAAPVPALPAADAPTPIDAFVRAPLRARGIAWNQQADRATLLRRLSLDLTGLPPTADEVAAFVADAAPDAYERAVDRLLASPHCAERLALPWLDASRYADTNGFSIDGGRHMWLWRDWVIAAFAANKPFDRFLVEQLAGGPLPDAERQQLAAYVARRAPALEPLRVDLQNARERLAVRTQKFAAMVMDTRAEPRPTHVLHRGVYDQPREPVAAGVPAALPPLPAGVVADRLVLARWAVDPAHPLTARVAVNRFWQMLFGAGLVRTPADFGTQGELPTHPELLDWLAVDFVRHGWDVRRLLRQIVTSATYRQSPVVDAAARARDPDNRLLARQLPNQCRDVDQATAAVLKDLRQRGLLDDTLVVFATEFG